MDLCAEFPVQCQCLCQHIVDGSCCGLNYGSPERYVQVLTSVPANVTLSGNSVFADVMNYNEVTLKEGWVLAQWFMSYKKTEMQ